MAWDTDTLRGRMFTQFVALCYYEYLRQPPKTSFFAGCAGILPAFFNKMRASSPRSQGFSEVALSVESVKMSSKLVSKSWTTEITARDKLFLEKIGVSVPFFNTIGTCNPDDHYMLPPEDRLVGAQLHRYIKDKLYWVLHAPRQTPAKRLS